MARTAFNRAVISAITARPCSTHATPAATSGSAFTCTYASRRTIRPRGGEIVGLDLPPTALHVIRPAQRADIDVKRSADPWCRLLAWENCGVHPARVARSDAAAAVVGHHDGRFFGRFVVRDRSARGSSCRRTNGEGHRPARLSFRPPVGSAGERGADRRRHRAVDAHGRRGWTAMVILGATLRVDQGRSARASRTVVDSPSTTWSPSRNLVGDGGRDGQGQSCGGWKARRVGCGDRRRRPRAFASAAPEPGPSGEEVPDDGLACRWPASFRRRQRPARACRGARHIGTDESARAAWTAAGCGSVGRRRA